MALGVVVLACMLEMTFGAHGTAAAVIGSAFLVTVIALQYRRMQRGM